MRHSEAKAATRIAFPWIVRLRYALVAGQVITVLVARYVFAIALPVTWLALPPVLVALSNLWISGFAGGWGINRRPASLIVWIFVLDILCLTASLSLSGGPNNPFTLLYLVQITLSAAILTRRETWAVGALSSLCFASLFWIYLPIPQLQMHHHGTGPNLHLVGMWIAFAVASTMVALFAGKISELLREHESSMLRIQDELAKKDRLAALATLAAGAAHELSTPLATIAVVAKELEHYGTDAIRDAVVTDDSRLVRKEVDRCRAILSRMRVEGADPSGEPLDDVCVTTLVSAVATTFPGAVRVTELPDDSSLIRAIPRHALEQALVALVKNAVEASTEAAVDISVREQANEFIIQVRDTGSGMTPEVLRHAGEPFFTTKDPGKGMGLGIFLVRTLAERLGGSLDISSAPGSGTVASLRLPMTRTGGRVYA